MIQRMQTVYLTVAAAMMAIFLWRPLFAINSTVPYLASACKMGFAFSLIFLVLALITVFLYTNRKLQMWFAWGMVFANLLVIFFYSVHYYFLLKGSPPAHPGDYIEPRFGAVLPVLTLIFTLIAIANINKDEKLVRESDRLR